MQKFAKIYTIVCDDVKLNFGGNFDIYASFAALQKVLTVLFTNSREMEINVGMNVNSLENFCSIWSVFNTYPVHFQ